MVKDSKIAIIAPYEELSLLASRVSKELEEDIEIRTGDLSEGVAIAQQLIKEGIKIFISRGGTATAIMASENVPVVEIKISGFDIIRAISKAKEKGNRIGVVGFKNVIYGSQSLNEILDVEIYEFEIESSFEAENGVLSAIEQKVDVLVGDAVATRIAEKYGLESVLITSGKESVSAAIREAHEIMTLHRQEQARTEQLKAILEFAYEGIVAVDQQGYVTLMNPEAEKMLHLNKDIVIGEHASKVLSEIPFSEVLNFGMIRSGEISNINGNMLANNVVPVIINNQSVGAVATIQDIKYIKKVEEKVRKTQYAKGLVAHYSFSDIVTTTQVMQETIGRARKFAEVDSTVLINGETGTGKEMFAQGIHNSSKRKNEPFVAVNCAALTESILASELFGYEDGAFTGAKKGGKIGLFELAHGGTIFLDEIAEISTSMQARLLRVLQEKEIMRIGGDKVIPIDVRVIAATCKNLDNLIEKGQFRRDLYHRISVLVVNIPPLRKRIEDIPVLIRVLCRDLSKRLEIESPDFDDRAIELLKSCTWLGNIRELKNILEQLIVLKQHGKVSVRDVSSILSSLNSNKASSIYESNENDCISTTSLTELEDQTIISVIKSSRSKKEAAEKLGISTTTLWRKMKNISKRNDITK